MVGWHHRLNGHELVQAPWVGDGQGSLVCCRPWGCKQSDTTERLNWTESITSTKRNLTHFSLICFLVTKLYSTVLWPPWTVACQPTLPYSACSWDFPGKKIRVGCHFLLQGIFLTQGSNLQLLHWQGNSLPLSHQGKMGATKICEGLISILPPPTKESPLSWDLYIELPQDFWWEFLDANVWNLLDQISKSWV